VISIVALWILAVLSLASVGSAHRVSLELKVAQYQLDRLRAAEAAEAGLRRAASEILSCVSGFDCEGKGWMDNPEAFQDVALDGASFSVWHSSKTLNGELTIAYGVEDEERRINVNTASRQVLERIPGITSDVAERIVEFRGRERIVGNEREALGYRTMEEFRDQAGIPDDLFEGVGEFLTVFGSGKVNVNTATPDVLVALGVLPAIVGRIEILRATGKPFTNRELILDELETLGPLTGEEIRTLQFLIRRGTISTTSTAFRINSEGRSGRAKVALEVVLERGKRGAMVATYWKRT
jgi:DNA uptake protein ComE-like DNA-binding protein